LTRVTETMASLVLADSAVVAAAAGVSSLVRQLWPARRKWVRPLAAVAAALTATALAATGRRVPVEAAGILLAAVVAGWLTVTAGRAWSRVATAGWRALRPRRKVQSHLYIWADGVAGAAMTAYIGRQLPGPWVVTATSVLLGAAVGSIRLGRTRPDSAARDGCPVDPDPAADTSVARSDSAARSDVGASQAVRRAGALPRS
jgi:hypothetical protein